MIIILASGLYSEQQVLLAIVVLVQSRLDFLVCFSVLDLLCKSCLFHETAFLLEKDRYDKGIGYTNCDISTGWHGL